MDSTSHLVYDLYRNLVAKPFRLRKKQAYFVSRCDVNCKGPGLSVVFETPTSHLGSHGNMVVLQRIFQEKLQG